MILQATQDYTPQYISICGTILGTLLGWLLKDITDNSGKIIFNIETFEMMVSKRGQYAYNLKLFICNETSKTVHIKNMKVEFYSDKELIYKCDPRVNSDCKNYRNIKNKKKISIISLRSYEAGEWILCDLFKRDAINNITNVTKITLSYENQKGRKKYISTTNIIDNNVKQYNDGDAFPE